MNWINLLFGLAESLWIDFWSIREGEETQREAIEAQNRLAEQALVLKYEQLKLLKNALYMVGLLALIYIVLKET